MDLEERIIKYQSGKISLYDFIYSCDCGGDWGSCQYDTACQMFSCLDFLQQKGYNPFEVLKINDVNRPAFTSADIAHVVEEFVSDVTEQIQECYPDEEDKEIREEALEDLKKIKPDESTIDSVFLAAKHNSWDLWTIALTVCVWLYGEEYEKYLKEAIGKSPGFGPHFNILAQSQNYVVGTICYLLYTDGLITDPHRVYDGFDT
jgi:hypothetical protein